MIVRSSVVTPSTFPVDLHGEWRLIGRPSDALDSGFPRNGSGRFEFAHDLV